MSAQATTKANTPRIRRIVVGKINGSKKGTLLCENEGWK